MNFDYTDEFENFFLVIFHINGIPFSALVDKESHSVIDISTLVSGNYNASHPYDRDTPLKHIDWLGVDYFTYESAIKEYFDANY